MGRSEEQSGGKDEGSSVVCRTLGVGQRNSREEKVRGPPLFVGPQGRSGNLILVSREEKLRGLLFVGPQGRSGNLIGVGREEKVRGPQLFIGR